MKSILCSLGVCVVVWPALLLAGTRPEGSEQIGQIQQELERLKEENARTRARMEELEKQLGALRQENAAKSAELEQKVETIRPTTSSLNDALTGYWGEHRFIITGSGNARYRWAGRGEANTFSAAVDPSFCTDSRTAPFSKQRLNSNSLKMERLRRNWSMPSSTISSTTTPR